MKFQELNRNISLFILVKLDITCFFMIASSSKENLKIVSSCISCSIKASFKSSCIIKLVVAFNSKDHAHVK